MALSGELNVSTVSGTGPVYSNSLLAAGAKPVTGPTLVGRIGFFDGKRDRFDFEGTIYEAVS